MRPTILLLMITLAGYGQPGLGPPKYEVASIKPNTDNDFRFEFRIEPSGPLAATGITLKRLMMTAYNVQGFRIVGGPSWVVSRRWDVQAKPDRVASSDQIRPMLRALLADRFQLRSHSEKRQLPVYELSVDRKGSKVQRVKDSETKADVRVGAGLIQLTKATTATFASQLSYALGRPVIDKTSSPANSISRSSGPLNPARMADPQPPACPPEPVISPLQPQRGRLFSRQSRSS